MVRLEGGDALIEGKGSFIPRLLGFLCSQTGAWKRDKGKGDVERRIYMDSRMKGCVESKTIQ